MPKPVEFFYKIVNFAPPPYEQSGQPGRWGFSIQIDRNFARRTLSIELPNNIRDNLNKDARFIVGGYFGREFEGEGRYAFYNETGLLKIATAFGNACQIGLLPDDIQDLEREVKDPKIREQVNMESFPLLYNPHNVDTQEQAACLLSLWTNWADRISRFLAREERRS